MAAIVSLTCGVYEYFMVSRVLRKATAIFALIPEDLASTSRAKRRSPDPFTLVKEGPT